MIISFLPVFTLEISQIYYKKKIVLYNVLNLGFVLFLTFYLKIALKFIQIGYKRYMLLLSLNFFDMKN